MSNRLRIPYQREGVKEEDYDQYQYPDLYAGNQPLINPQYVPRTFQFLPSNLSMPENNEQPFENNNRSELKNIKREYDVQPTVNLDEKKIANMELRKYQKAVTSMLQQTNATDSVEFIEEVKKQLRENFFSTISIENEMKDICFKIFYYPSIMLSNAIKENYGIEEEAVIYKSVALKHADLIMLLEALDERNDKNFLDAKNEVEYVMKYLRTWGKYLVDINKLEVSASNKTGDSTNRVYHITELEMKITIGEFVTVHYKGSEITPTKFKNEIIKEMALERLRKKATEVLYQIMVNNQFPYMFKK